MLTETWAAAYFQSLIVIVLFLLGVPALLLQIVAPSVDLNRLVQRRFRFSRQAYVVLTAAVGITIWFLWVMHPTDDGARQPTLLPANGLMTAAILLAGGSWAYYFRRFTRTGIVRRIQRAIVVNHLLRGVAHEEAERNLGFVGEMSRAGREKEEILRVFEAVLGEIIAGPGYDGTRLLLLVDGVKRTLLTPGHLGNEGNFRSGARMLAEAARQVRGRSPSSLSSSSDVRWVEETIAAIALVAAANGFKVCHELLELLSTEKLLDVGIAASRVGEVTIYANAVSKLRAQYLEARGRGGEVELISALLTLLAHVASGGHSARRWSGERLEGVRAALGRTVYKTTLRRAREERYELGDFESADMLTALLAAPEAPQRARRGRGPVAGRREEAPSRR